MKVFPALHPGCFARFGDRAGAEPGNGDELIFGDPFVWRYRRSQLIALPVPGGAGPVQYRYAVRVSGHCVPVSYQLVQQMVGEFNRQAEAFACRNSTDDTATGGELKSTSPVTTQKNDRLSSGARVTRTTACSLLSGSARSSKGWMHER
ncbi:hypothetical protein AFK66_021725 [Cronobacter malonaticus LMG 23826]|nr:hypothetical protein AFK66_021725 [Cronobacter malonaticus LMG 23826]